MQGASVHHQKCQKRPVVSKRLSHLGTSTNLAASRLGFPFYAADVPSPYRRISREHAPSRDTFQIQSSPLCRENHSTPETTKTPWITFSAHPGFCVRKRRRFDQKNPTLLSMNLLLTEPLCSVRYIWCWYWSRLCKIPMLIVTIFSCPTIFLY